MRSFRLPSLRSTLTSALLATVGCSTAFDDSLADNAGRQGNAGQAGSLGQSGGNAGQSGAAGRGGTSGGAGATIGGSGGTSAGAAGATPGGAGQGGTNAGAAGQGGANAGAAGKSGANGGTAGSSGGAGAGGAAGGKGGGAGAGGGNACTQGQTRCAGDNRETCAAGVFGGSVTCAVGCKDGACLPCGSSGPTCSGDTSVRTCNAEGVAVTTSCGGQICANGSCVPCPSGSPVKCVGADRVGCKGGKLEVLETCGPELCAPDGCLECTAGQKACLGSNITTCLSGKLVPSQECAPLACANGACVAECAIGERRCQGKALQQCVNGLFTTVEQCNATETCDANDGVCRVCTEGTKRCTGLATEICSDGKWASDKSCSVGCAKTPTGTACLTTITAIAAGPGRTCVLAGTGAGSSLRPFCWGDSSNGELGVVGSALAPRYLSELPYSSAIAMGRAHTCVVTSGTTVRCAGANDYGQLGRITAGMSSATFSPVNDLSPSGTIQAIFAGDDLTCVRRSTGAVDCWGRFADGSQHIAPVRIASSGVAVLGIGRGSLGLQSSSALTEPLRSFGRNETGQLGIGTISNLDQPFPGTSVDAISGTKFCATGGERTLAGTPIGHACAVDGGGNLFCWGLNDFSQIGVAASTNNVSIDGTLRGVTPTPNLVFSDAGKVVAGRAHTCVRRTGTLDGAIWCFGENPDGRAGLPLEPAALPRQVPLPSGASDLAVGDDHTCAVVEPAPGSTGRSVQCWGANDRGQLGDGGAGSGSPRQVVLSAN